MTADNDLVQTERSAFRTVADTGLWDLMIASVVAMFAIAPLLSRFMGDFWSSALFLPVCAAVYLLARVVRERVVLPRVGEVRFGEFRRRRLRKLTVVMLVVNVIALVLGLIAATRGPSAGLGLFPLVPALVALIGFSMAAYLLEIPRFYLYGILLATGPLLGEWLWRQGLASHHGFPVVFGAAATLIALIGLARFARLLKTHPRLEPEPSAHGPG